MATWSVCCYQKTFGVVQWTMYELSSGNRFYIVGWNTLPNAKSDWYNPNKPAKYGLVFKSLNSVRYPYTYVTAPYAGKPQEGEGEFYYPGTENVTMYLVDRLDSVQPLEGRNVSFDSLYTSFTLACYMASKRFWIFKLVYYVIRL